MSGSKLLRKMVNETLELHPKDPTSLKEVLQASQFLRSAEVKPHGQGGWCGDPSFLLEILKRDPKRLPQLIGPRTIHHTRVDTLLAVDHRPTAGIAERVAKHRQLTRTGIEYVLEHGTKPAIDVLFDKHFADLTDDDIRTASKRVEEVSEALIYWDPPMLPYVRYYPDSQWLLFVTEQLEVLTRLSDDRVARNRSEARFVVVAAANAGLDIPKRFEDMAAGLPDLTTHRTGSWRHRMSAADAMVLLNPLFGRMLNYSLTSRGQADFLRVYPYWSVLAQCRRPDIVVKSSTVHLHEEGGEIPDGLVLKLPLPYLRGQHGTGPAILRVVSKKLGDDKDAWANFVGLEDSWTASLGELLETLDAL